MPSLSFCFLECFGDLGVALICCIWVFLGGFFFLLLLFSLFIMQFIWFLFYLFLFPPFLYNALSTIYLPVCIEKTGDGICGFAQNLYSNGPFNLSLNIFIFGIEFIGLHLIRKSCGCYVQHLV